MDLDGFYLQREDTNLPLTQKMSEEKARVLYNRISGYFRCVEIKYSTGIANLSAREKANITIMKTKVTGNRLFGIKMRRYMK